MDIGQDAARKSSNSMAVIYCCWSRPGCRFQSARWRFVSDLVAQFNELSVTDGAPGQAGVPEIIRKKKHFHLRSWPF